MRVKAHFKAKTNLSLPTVDDMLNIKIQRGPMPDGTLGFYFVAKFVLRNMGGDDVGNPYLVKGKSLVFSSIPAKAVQAAVASMRGAGLTNGDPG